MDQLKDDVRMLLFRAQVASVVHWRQQPADAVRLSQSTVVISNQLLALPAETIAQRVTNALSESGQEVQTVAPTLSHLIQAEEEAQIHVPKPRKRMTPKAGTPVSFRPGAGSPFPSSSTPLAEKMREYLELSDRLAVVEEDLRGMLAPGTELPRASTNGHAKAAASAPAKKSGARVTSDRCKTCGEKKPLKWGRCDDCRTGRSQTVVEDLEESED